MKKLLSLLVIVAPLGLALPALAQSTGTTASPSADTKPAQSSSDNGGVVQGVKKDAKKAWSATKSTSKKVWNSAKKGASTVKTDAKRAMKGDGSTSVNKPVGSTGSEPTAGSSGH